MKAFIVPLLAAALSASAGQPLPTLTGTPPAAFPDSHNTLTLSAAVAMASRNNAQLQALAAEVAALAGRTTQAGARPNPTLDYLREGRRDQGGAVNLQLSIPLELGGKQTARIDAASTESQVAMAVLAAARLRVRADVIAAFHETWLAEQRLVLAGLAAAAAGRSSANARARVEAGKISPVEATRASVAQANVALETIQARRELTEARARLTLLLGADPGALAAPDASMPAARSAAELATALERSPSTQRAAADLAHRQANVRLESARRYPDLALIVGQKREGPGRERQAVVGLSAPLPLFDRNRGAITEAQRRVDKAGAELAMVRQRLLADATQASARLTAALEQEAVIRRDILPGARSAFAAAGKGFEAGKFSVLEVLDAQRSLFQAQAQHLRVMADAHRADADLAALIGPAASAPAPVLLEQTP